jgi:hypothetical protein
MNDRNSGDRFEVYTVRPATRDGDKDWWTRIGTAWPTKNGGFTVRLDALPIPDATGCKLILMPPKDEDWGERRREPRNGRSRGGPRHVERRDFAPPPPPPPSAEDDEPF